ncbi:MAG: hypothetical protein DLM53_11085 [Candidatus Eremiobacter antarcticus]|nr:MAG: hypothetical protein DLM53_11085 [Candidatus Eremiobacter sp. RRmetagenome_bin22]
MQSIRPYLVGFVLLLSATCVSASAAPLSSSSRIGPRGVGPIVFGVAQRQAVETGTRFTLSKPSTGSTCFMLYPRTPAGLAFMVENGSIRRAEVTGKTIASVDGFRVGDSGATLLRFYGQRARLSPNKYDPKVEMAVIEPKSSADAKYRMTYSLKNGAVQTIVAGLLPQVAYVEGCS